VRNEKFEAAMIEIPFTFPLANGLHARPASQLQEICLRFAATIFLRNNRNRNRADTRSILELVASETNVSDPCYLNVSGSDEKAAGQALRVFLLQILPHADDNLPPPLPTSSKKAWLPPVFHDGAARIFPGRPLAPGICCARAVYLQKIRNLPRRFAAGRSNAKKELLLFQNACRKLEADLRKKAASLQDANAAGIMKAHLAIITDPGFQGRICELIAKKKMPAGQAIVGTAEHFARTLRRSQSAYLRERVDDLHDLALQLGEKLYGRSDDHLRCILRTASVVVASVLAPSELLALDRRRLRGLVLGDIGLTSHTAILARSFQIPAVALSPQDLGKIKNAEKLIVDGRRGLVCLRPGPALKRYYRLEEMKLRLRSRQLARLKNEPAQSADGRKLAIAANIGNTAELALTWKNGAEAIGLFRTETLFLGRDTPPGEDEQFAVYSQVASSAKGRQVIIRTLDIGGDKHLPYLALPREDNPYLGYRAVRFYGEHEELIRCQLRAILRAARHGSLKVMVPMVTGPEEVRLVRRLLAAAAAELRERKIPHAAAIEVGTMVETPAAALSLASLSRESDFFSVGSNDLLQYFLAADRGNAKLEDLYDPLHPAFLRLLFQVAGQARKTKRWLGMCGEMAGNPDFLPLLVGLGFDELSLAAGLIPQVKTRLRQLRNDDCRGLLQKAMCCASSREVSEMLRDFNNRSLDAGAIVKELIRLDSTSRTADEAIKELCDLLELGGRLEDASALEEAVWKREQVYATDLGFGFAIPHGKSPQVRATSVAFLRPRRPFHWLGKSATPIRGVLLIAVPTAAKGEEHLKLIARLSRLLMHEIFRAELLAALDTDIALAILQQCLQGSLDTMNIS
jgi:phosphoenolpyruvate-protein phosphotransferase